MNINKFAPRKPNVKDFESARLLADKILLKNRLAHDRVRMNCSMFSDIEDLVSDMSSCSISRQELKEKKVGNYKLKKGIFNNEKVKVPGKLHNSFYGSMPVSLNINQKISIKDAFGCLAKCSANDSGTRKNLTRVVKKPNETPKFGKDFFGVNKEYRIENGINPFYLRPSNACKGIDEKVDRRRDVRVTIRDITVKNNKVVRKV